MLFRERIDASCENDTEHNDCARHGVTKTEQVVGIYTYFRERNTDSCNISDHYYTSS
jgi:hypothetical protein